MCKPRVKKPVVEVAFLPHPPQQSQPSRPVRRTASAPARRSQLCGGWSGLPPAALAALRPLVASTRLEAAFRLHSRPLEGAARGPAVYSWCTGSLIRPGRDEGPGFPNAGVTWPFVPVGDTGFEPVTSSV
jgi:hypothetical protein